MQVLAKGVVKVELGFKPGQGNSLNECISRNDCFGMLRLTLAIFVLIDHSWTLGFGEEGLGWLGIETGGQLNRLPTLGFLIISGYFISRSAGMLSVGRFLWHRGLRILPGLWVCLLVTAIVFAPIAAAREDISLSGQWFAADGPVTYVWVNAFASMNQFGISGLLENVPYSAGPGTGVFDGSLWSLKYEMLAYLAAVLLCGGLIFQQYRKAIALLAGVVFLTLAVWITYNTVRFGSWPYTIPGATPNLPLIGPINVNQAVSLGSAFLLGMCMNVFGHRIPIRWQWAVLAGVTLAVSVFTAAFPVVGVPAWAYLLMYLAVKVRPPLRDQWRQHDYSYGVFLYAFPVQQMLALWGFTWGGVWGYSLVAAVVTLIIAAGSWHLVEQPMTRFRSIGIRTIARPTVQMKQETDRSVMVVADVDLSSKAAMPETTISPRSSGSARHRL